MSETTIESTFTAVDIDDLDEATRAWENLNHLAFCHPQIETTIHDDMPAVTVKIRGNDEFVICKTTTSDLPEIYISGEVSAVEAACQADVAAFGIHALLTAESGKPE